MQNIDIETTRSLATQHRAFYEVSLYYVVLDERPYGQEPVTRKIQAGFDIDIFGVNIDDRLTMPGPDPDYKLGCEALHNVAEQISTHTSNNCVLEVNTFPSTAILDTRNRAVEAMIRIRIHHFRGLDQPAGSAEQQALDELERELNSLGIHRR